MQRDSPRLFYILLTALGLSFIYSCAPRSSSALAPTPQPVSQVVQTGSSCNQTPPATLPDSVVVNGLARSFITYVPETYDPARAYPLVFAFHGRTNPNDRVRRYFGLERALPDAIIVYPSGLWQGSGFTWSDPGDPLDNLRDYALFDAMLQRLDELYCIDTTRIFAVGHSLGAYFANELACARAGTVRAVASLAGGLRLKDCAGEVAALLFHNPNDRLVPVSEGETARSFFVMQNGAAGPAPITHEPLRSFNCYWHADNAHPVAWCPHGFDYGFDGRYYPHNWPDGTAQAIAYFFTTLP